MIWVVKEEKAHEPLITPEIAKEAARVRRELQGANKEPRSSNVKGCPIGEKYFQGAVLRRMRAENDKHSYVKHYADGSRMRIDGYFA